MSHLPRSTAPILLADYSVGGTPAALPAPWSLLAALVADYLTTCLACSIAQVERDLQVAHCRIAHQRWCLRQQLAAARQTQYLVALRLDALVHLDLHLPRLESTRLRPLVDFLRRR